jgi:hypothetical protein
VLLYRLYLSDLISPKKHKRDIGFSRKHGNNKMLEENFFFCKRLNRLFIYIKQIRAKLPHVRKYFV